jgi:hypothetical protein
MLLVICTGIAFSEEVSQKNEAEAIIGPDGGTLEVGNPSSPLYGVKLNIPKGILNKDTAISISVVDEGPELSGGRCWDKAGNRIVIPKPKPITRIISISPKAILLNSKLIIPFDGSKIENKMWCFVMGYEPGTESRKDPNPWELLTSEPPDVTQNTITVYIMYNYFNVQLQQFTHPDECYTSHAGRD